MILDLPALTTPLSKETLFIYQATSKEVVSAVLRLRRYFEAHPITVITDQPIKQVLSKADTSGKLAQYSVELGAYNITYDPRSAIKGWILADFINEVPVGSETMVPWQTHYIINRQIDCEEEWILYTDGASSVKGSGANLVLISLTKTEYIYALRLNFESPNNQADYKALLAGLKITKKIGVQSLSANILVETLDVPLMDVEEINAVVEEEGETWMTYIVNCLEKGVWPEDQNKARALRMKIGQYVMEKGVMFKKSYLMPMLQCVGSLQANYVIREIHIGTCSMHLKARSVVAKAIRQGYYWPTMHRDAREEIRNGGMDVLGPLPEAPRKVKFVIVAVDYFTKWIEAKPLAKTTGKEVKKFVWDNIVCMFSTQKVNGLVERANRSLMEGIKTQLGRERKGWVDELPNILWAHQTSLKTSNGETPYSLTFRSEAVSPAEISMTAHRTMMIKEGEGNKEEIRLNLDLLTERREAAAIQEARYKMKVEQYYNKRVRSVYFRVDEYVCRKNEASRVEKLGKLGPKWEGPYLVVEAYQNDSYKLRTMDDREVPRVWHAINLRKCYM
ncbi:reverse transcriptase domain-containing protein [Tanacetum coccineum]